MLLSMIVLLLFYYEEFHHGVECFLKFCFSVSGFVIGGARSALTGFFFKQIELVE